MTSDPLTGLSSLTSSVQFNATAALENLGAPKRGTRLAGDAAKAAEDFEAFYLAQVTANMFAGVETDPLFGGGPGEAVFRSMMTQEYGKLLAKAGGIGIADSVAREMLKLQEAE